jgi:opacity protein-like surface antigen
MKKLLLLFCLLPMLAVVGFAQESRQDASISAIGTYQPTITGNAVTQTSTLGKGALLSYRFMLTPSSAIEGNYQYSQFDMKYVLGGQSNSASYSNARFHTSLQEGSVAYVHSFVYKKFNPFAEAGAAMLLFDPINDTGTTTNVGTRTKATALLVGGGIAYELSPSWDLRVQYRAEVFKSIDFGLGQFKTNRWYVMQQPAIGFAYHF